MIETLFSLTEKAGRVRNFWEFTARLPFYVRPGDIVWIGSEAYKVAASSYGVESFQAAAELTPVDTWNIDFRAEGWRLLESDITDD